MQCIRLYSPLHVTLIHPNKHQCTRIHFQAKFHRQMAESDASASARGADPVRELISNVEELQVWEACVDDGGAYVCNI